METSQKKQTSTHKSHAKSINHKISGNHKLAGTPVKTKVTKTSHIGRVAANLLHHGKKVANELYDEGMHKVGNVEETAKEYSDELLTHIQRKPLVSLLIAGGIGFLLSTLFKK